MARTFTFGGHNFEVAGDAALYWPEQKMLVVSDLHLEKASAYAAGGQMLPPYDSLATLEQVAALVDQFVPEIVISLGDNFHDTDGERRLQGRASALLKRLVTSVRWIWVTGNHDPDVQGHWGGEAVETLKCGNVIFRHEALGAEEGPEISGHFHPKFRQAVRGRHVSRRCFVRSARKLVMPAFGTLTGGLDVQDPALIAAFGCTDVDRVEVLVPTRDGIALFTVPASHALAK
ncbi:MAG: phosphoesterase [Sphingopyxis sp.]|nr:phosphoesterase [Sphingopyxis sp.]